MVIFKVRKQHNLKALTPKDTKSQSLYFILTPAYQDGSFFLFILHLELKTFL